MQQKLKETAGHPTCTLVTQFIDAWLAQCSFPRSNLQTNRNLEMGKSNSFNKPRNVSSIYRALTILMFCDFYNSIKVISQSSPCNE